MSFELRFAQIRDLKKLLPAEAIVYGRLPLMITENCLIQNAHRLPPGPGRRLCAGGRPLPGRPTP